MRVAMPLRPGKDRYGVALGNFLEALADTRDSVAPDDPTAKRLFTQSAATHPRGLPDHCLRGK